MGTQNLVGRDAELGVVGRFITGQTDSSVLALEGEAGIGKTSLWRRAQAAAVAQGRIVLSAVPAASESAAPYAVLRDLFDRVPDRAYTVLPSVMRQALEVALLQAPADGTAAEQAAVAAAVLRVLRELAASSPLLVAVDDAQWADEPSLRALAHAARRLDAERCRYLLTMRVPAAPADRLTAIFGIGAVERLAVKPLQDQAIDDLLLRRLSRPLRRPELRLVHRAAAGNPYFAIEIGRFLIEQPAGHQDIPPTLVALLERRLTQLPAASRHVLIGLAALGRPFMGPPEALGPKAADALRVALDAQVVERADGALRFAHPLLASAVYALATPGARRRWHLHLAGFASETEERARHLALAATGPDPAVAEALESAARSANARGAPEAAAALAQQAADLTPPHLREAQEQRLILTAEFLLRAGDPPRARQVLERVLEEPDRCARSAEALRLLAAILFASGDLPEVVSLLQDARRRASGDPHTMAVIERDLVHAHMQQGEFRKGLEHSRRLARIAARSRDSSLTATAQRLTAIAQHHLGGMSARSRRRAVAAITGDGGAEAETAVGGLHPLLDWVVVLKWSDDFDHARMGLRRALELTDGRDESLRAPILFHAAELECWTGNWDRAEAYVRECERSVRHAGQRTFERLACTAAALLHCYRGELEEAETAAQAALRIAAEIGDHPFRQRALAILGLAALSWGDPAAAVEHFQGLHRGGASTGFRNAIRSQGDEVEALVAIGRHDNARALASGLAGQSEPWPRAIGARCRGLLAAARGQFDDAIAELEAALEAHAELGMPLEEARTLLAYGSVLRRARRRRAAGIRLREAATRLDALGARAWSRRAQEELQRLAAGPSTGAGPLSRRELEVARLVATGLSNDEIAQRLFMSRRTAESHVAHILNKLSLRNRAELVAWMFANDS